MKANRLIFTPAAFATLAMALSLAACSGEEPADAPLAGGPVAAQVTAGISQTLTRISVGDDGSASFTTDDVIHVVANETSTYDYTLQSDGSWSAGSNPYYFQDLNSVSFQAWFASPNVSVETNNTINIDTKLQTLDDDGWNVNDILVSGTVQASVVGGASVDFTGENAFGHIMSQLVFTFKAGDGISNLTNLTRYTVKDVITDATFNTLTCELTPGSIIGDISNNVNGELDAQVDCTPIILVPQTFTNASNNLTLEVTYNSQTYKATLTVPDNELQTGHSYAYTVTISNTGLKVSTAQINKWQTGAGGSGEAIL